MSLEAGHKLAHYEILEPIGKGGMGEVYRAKDGKLGRDVAIKVLPEELARDEERLKWFQREAKVLASLNHPNIAAIYGVEHDGSVHYLVLELVEGETLAERIVRGSIPVDEALALAKQIAEALEAAHGQGIVHRDLKPANVKITPDGVVKVLDFGLAKAYKEEAASGDDSMSPTITRHATQAGIILGTASYMAPEQARGRSVDTRADVWAFGVVLYEMLTGERPFRGEDISLTLAAVMTAEPDLGRLPGELSPALETFLKRCLQKDPRRRVQAVGDMRLAIEGAFDVALPRGDARTSRVAPWGIAAAAILIAVVAMVSSRVERGDAEPPRPERRFTIDTVEGTRLPRGIGTAVAVSPDGETLVYAAEGEDGRQLYRRSLAELEAVPIRGTAGATMPFFSPDGAWVAYGSEIITTIKRVPLSGGEPLTVCTECADGFWSEDGGIVFEWAGTLRRAPDIGGEAEVILGPMPEHGINALSRVSLLPGSRAVLFEIGSFEFGGVGVFSLESEKLIVVTDNGTDPFYVARGHIVFARERTLFAVPFDVERFEVTGEATPVLSGVRVENGGSVQAAVSENGLLAYVPAEEQIGTRLVWVDRNGGAESAFDEVRVFYGPRLSPDGRQIAVAVKDGSESDIWIYRSETSQRLTDTGDASNPIWTPDGRSVTFSSRAGDSFAIQSAAADGEGGVRTNLVSDVPMVPEAWSPDGSHLFFGEQRKTPDLFVFDVRQPDSRSAFVVSDASEHSATVSPSGRWVAYASNRTGSFEIYLRAFPGPGREYRVSRGGGADPSWGRDDHELMFRSPGAFNVATFRFDTTGVIVEQQRRLFGAGSYWIAPGHRHYDVHPDGNRFLMLDQGDAGTTHSTLHIVENWFSELR